MKATKNLDMKKLAFYFDFDILILVSADIGSE